MNSNNIMTITLSDASKAQEVKDLIANTIISKYLPYVSDMSELVEEQNTIDNIRIEGAALVLDKAEGCMIPDAFDDELNDILPIIAKTYKDMPFVCQAETYETYDVKYENGTLQIDSVCVPMGYFLMEDETPESDATVIDLGEETLVIPHHPCERLSPIYSSRTIVIE